SFAVSNVTVNSLPVISVNSGTICSGSSFLIIPTGAQTYTYTGGTALVSPTVSTTYSVSGTSSAGCVGATSALSSVTVHSLPLITATSGSICEGTSFAIIPSGAATYTVSGGSLVVSPTLTSTYSVSGTSSLGCVSSTPALSTVTVNPYPTVGVNSGVICSGTTFTMTATGASSYSFSGGSAIVTPSISSSYTVTGISSAGCSSFAVSNVTVNSLPVISVNGGGVCLGNSFTLSPTGASSYTYSSGTAIVSPSSTSSYSITGTNSFGCVSLIPVIATVTVSTVSTISVNSGTMCNGDSFTFSPTGASSYSYTGGSAIVSPTVTSTYTISGSTAGCQALPAVSTLTVRALPLLSVTNGSLCSGDLFTISPSGAATYTYSGGSSVVSPSVSTSYSVIGKDAQGCVSLPTLVTVSVFARPTVIAVNGTICAGASFTLSASGASSYSYSSGSAVVSPSINATYSVIGTSSAGCASAPAFCTVSVNLIPQIAVNSGTLCAGTTFTLAPSGAFSYSFSGGSAVVSPTSSTSFSVTGTSSAGCTSSAAAISSVVVYGAPLISVSGGTSCAGNTFTISPSGAVSYTYSGGSAIVAPTVSSTYSVIGTDALGCKSTIPGTLLVNVYTLPVISVNSGAICMGNSYTLIPAGGNSYTVSGGSTVVSPTTTSSYFVLGTSSVGCVSASPAIATMTVNALPIISVNSGSICAGSVFTMVPGGASSYTFSGGSATVSPASNSLYSVSGTSTAGCISFSAATSSVVVKSLPAITVNSGSVCMGSSFTINPSGAFSYTISGGNSIVQPSVSTVYSVTGTGTNGCSSSAPVLSSVSAFSLPVIIVTSGSICAGSSFAINPTGALTYTITGGSGTVSPLTTTAYSISGTDAQGCVSANLAISTVTVNSLPLVSVNSGTVCSGSVFILIPAGASTYTFSTGSATVQPTVNTGYSVTGTSSAGCVSATSAIANVTVVPLPVLAVNNGSVCAGSSFTLNPSGALTYSFSSGSSVVTPTASSMYTVTGSGAGGCVAFNSAISQVFVRPVPTISVSNGTVCAGNSFTLSPTGAFSFSYSGGSAVVSPAITSNYTITGKNQYNCASQSFATVSVMPVPSLSIFASPEVVCRGEKSTLTVFGADSYVWNNASTSSSLIVIPLSNNTYSVTGFYVNGCKSSSSHTLTVNECLGLHSVHLPERDFAVYPNPTSGEFVIEVDRDSEIVIVNMIGEVVLTQFIQRGLNSFELGTQDKGVYFIYIKGKEHLSVIKMIKQ
ncbi:MAG: T9SS type A sorting domain-containing protein, partial [bacterium]|nr:T9SS type A sorting domain-containing protein [bacterium]